MTKFPSAIWWSEYAEYMASPRWQEVRAGAVLRAKGLCERCGRTVQQVHHRSYERVGGDELPEDLEALCFGCHKKHHTKKKALPSKAKKPGAQQRARKKLKVAARARAPKKQRRMTVWTMADDGKLHPTAG